MMPTIPIQLSDSEVKKLDYLVKQGRYKSRNQAIKKYLEAGIAREQIDLDMIDTDYDKTKLEILALLDQCTNVSFHLKSSGTLADEISKDRDRN